MKVLMISTDRTLLGEQVGDGDVVARHQAYGQQVARLDIIIFSKSGYQTKQLADNIFCYAANSKNKLSYIKDTQKIARQLFSENFYDLIVCQDPFLTGLAGYFIKRKFKTKLLIHFHGDFWHNKYWLKQNIINYFLLFLSKFTVAKADAIRVVSSGIKAKINKNNIKIIPTPVNLAKIQNINNQTIASIKNEFKNKKIIFWLGRMESEKNLPWLINSFNLIIKKYPNTALILGGHGSQFNKIQKLVVKFNLENNIKLIGRINYSNLANYYHAADIFILPSLHESFGKVLLEAAAAAKPSVATATTGAKEIIKDKKTGYLVPINDQQEFIKKILKLLQDGQLARKIGTQAYRHVTQNFSYQGNIKQIISYWQEIVTGFVKSE